MKKEYVYERRQTAGRMEAVMVAVSVIGTAAAIVALLIHGWLSGLALLLLSAIAFALSRVFDLFDDVLASVSRLEENKKSEKADKAA
jgi:hypothetical protein